MPKAVRSATIANWMQQHYGQKVSLWQLQQTLSMPLVEIRLRLLHYPTLEAGKIIFSNSIILVYHFLQHNPPTTCRSRFCNTTFCTTTDYYNCNSPLVLVWRSVPRQKKPITLSIPAKGP